jgi:hypothetical protein
VKADDEKRGDRTSKRKNGSAAGALPVRPHPQVTGRLNLHQHAAFVAQNVMVFFGCSSSPVQSSPVQSSPTPIKKVDIDQNDCLCDGNIGFLNCAQVDKGHATCLACQLLLRLNPDTKELASQM